jgi:glutathione S-transferase
MSLTLHFHPLSSFCQKVLIALYENDTPFTPHLVDLMDEKAAADFRAIWPIGKFPVLRDEARNRLIPETSVIVEYLDRHYPGRTRLVPEDDDLASQMRVFDRLFDLYVNLQVQKVVFDRLRPEGSRDPLGAAEAKAMLHKALGVAETQIAGKTWIVGEDFTMADCAAAPALFYADKVTPFADTHPQTHAYLRRLMKRPSYMRALKEAKPYFDMFPQGDAG